MRKVLVMDSSQIESFLTCPTLWKYKYDEDLTHSNEVREDMAMGTYGHKLLEIYYTALALGASQESAVEQATHFHLTDEFPLSQPVKNKVLKRFNDYWMIYCTRDIIPAQGTPTKSIGFGEHTYLNSACTKCNSLIENEVSSSCPNNPITIYTKKPLVEQGFSYELLNNDEYLFVLEGRIDLIGEISGQMCWLDHKWQLRKRSLYQKSIQFRNYALVTDLSLGIINYIRLVDKFESDTLQRAIVSFPPWERREWKNELIEIYKQIVRDSENNEFYKNRASCAGKYGYPCEFTKICEESNLITIEAIKQANFKKKEKWSPW